MKEQIIKWFETDRSFDSGIALLYKYGKNKNFIRILEKNPKKNKGKLNYELLKLAGYSAAEYLQVKEYLENSPLQKTEQVIKPSTPPKKTIEKGKEDELPTEVKRVIHESKELLNERTELHKKLADIPDDNAPKNVKDRKEILDDIKVLSMTLDILYIAKDNYFKNGILPDIKRLFGKEENPKPKDLDGAELMKRKKNLESSLAKDRNQIKYQSKTASKHENPMPDGPKKQVIADRIKEKEIELEEINKKLSVN